MMHQHKEPGKCMHSEIKKWVNWVCFGVSASEEEGEPVPPLLQLCLCLSARSCFPSLAFLNPHDGATLHQILHYAPKNLPVLYRRLQAPLLSSPYFWLHWEVLSISNARQSPKQLWVLRISLMKPWGWMNPMPEATLRGGW